MLVLASGACVQMVVLASGACVQTVVLASGLLPAVAFVAAVAAAFVS